MGAVGKLLKRDDLALIDLGFTTVAKLAQPQVKSLVIWYRVTTKSAMLW